MTNKLEALLDAIAAMKQFHNPESIAYQLKNPLLILSFARPGKHEVDMEGRRVFHTLLAGYKSTLFDLEMKVSGKSRSGLRDGDTLANICGVFGLKERLGVEQVVKFLRKALKDPEISRDTPIAYFRESVKDKV